ncbi:MAG: hypothetical protein PUI88_07635 [Prevotella sp.]|nr:hypothetical protein [Prevotella sp.]
MKKTIAMALWSHRLQLTLYISMLLFLKLHTIRSIGVFLVNSVCHVPKPIKQIQCGFKNLRIHMENIASSRRYCYPVCGKSVHADEARKAKEKEISS